MKETYEQAIAKVFKDEGGFTNQSTDPGGPTNWGITIHDAQTFWKPGATADDVKAMPRSVAEDIYKEHYANAVWYDNLPPGVDYAVLDYAINSGIKRAIGTLQEVVNASTIDQIMGPETLAKTCQADYATTINKIWDARLAFNQSLTTLWPVYGRGWTNRINSGRNLSMSLLSQFLSLFQKGNQMPANQTEAPAHPVHTSTVDFPPFDPNTFLQDIEQALEAANTLLPALLPVIGAFYPPAAAFAKFLPLLPTVLGAVKAVHEQTSAHPLSVVSAAQDHLTPNAPNAPALNG
jgi:lysozyme family protein